MRETPLDADLAFMTDASGQAAPTDWIEEHRAEHVPVDLDDVIGLSAAKRELVALAARLTKPHSQMAIPRGILLSGPPGCGKTLLARVLTGLLSGPDGCVPMYEFPATELLEPDAFARIEHGFAGLPGRAVVFVDEIDLVARGRDDIRHSAESRRSLYGALALLDGLRRQEGLVWLFATSQDYVLDAAFLRPGRVDVKIKVDFPEQAEREQLFARQMARLPVVGELDLARAAAMVGSRRSPAAIIAVCQDALALAIGDGLTGLDWSHLVEAISREGHVEDDQISPELAWRCAVHEAGHAIVARLLDQPVVNVTILARHGGRTDLEELKPRLRMPSDALLGHLITIQLAGLAAETMILGDASLGSSSDVLAATGSALWRLGSGLDPDFGPISVSRIESQDGGNQAFGSAQSYLRARHADARNLLERHRGAVFAFAQTLLARRQLSGRELDEALAAAFAATDVTTSTAGQLV